MGLPRRRSSPSQLVLERTDGAIRVRVNDPSKVMVKRKLKLLAVLAHPDDESLGFGGTLAKYAAEGAEIYVVTATRGERGRFGPLVPGSD
jgi:hypothetical protein